jgi:hypothetical protein
MAQGKKRVQPMSKLEQVLIAHGALVPMKDIAPDVLGVQYKALSTSKVREALPFRIFRAGGTMKSPWVCHAEDYAAWLEKQVE